jgi:hypothetical protein
MREAVVLFLHLLATVAGLAGPRGARAVVAESLLVKQQLLILNRPRKRSPKLHLDAVEVNVRRSGLTVCTPFAPQKARTTCWVVEKNTSRGRPFVCYQCR